MSQAFCNHPYKYDGSDDSETDNDEKNIMIKSDEEKKIKKDKKERRSKTRKDSKDLSESDNDEKEKRRKHKSSKKKKHRKDTKEPSKEETTKDDSVSDGEDVPVKDESVEEETKKYPETDVESDGEDNSCVKMSIQFVSVIRNTIEKEDVHALRDTLKKTPIAVVLHYLHYLFHLVRKNSEFTEVMVEYNKKYNVVSRYFLKSLRSDERTVEVMESLKRVTEQITNRVPLDEIEGLLRFTPEMICMCTIQSGNMVSHDKITSEWELSRGFMKSRDLIAAFFGIKKYFSDPTRYSDRRDLIISCICGGSIKTLARIVRKTKTEYLTEYTIRKTRAICIPNAEMVKFLHEKYELSFY